MNIAARNGIRTKNNVLPKYGYKNCLDYVNQYKNNEKDTQIFIKEWKRVVNIQERRQKQQLTNDSKEEYYKLVNVWKNENWNTQKTIILEFNHWYNLTLKEHKQQAMDIYDHTYFGEIAVKPPVIRSHPTIYGKRTEYWEVKATTEAKQDEWATKSTYTALYHTCCEYRGYKP